MADHTGSEFVRVLDEYRRFVRSFFRSELRVIRTDCDPTFTVNHHGATHNTAVLQRYLDTSPPAVVFLAQSSAHSGHEPSERCSPALIPPGELLLGTVVALLVSLA